MYFFTVTTFKYTHIQNEKKQTFFSNLVVKNIVRCRGINLKKRQQEEEEQQLQMFFLYIWNFENLKSYF